jgi:hypothetical protein
MDNCKIVFVKPALERKLLYTNDSGEDKFIELCLGEVNPCPIPLPAQVPYVIRDVLDTTKLIITFVDANGYPIEEPQSHNGYTIETKEHPDDPEWFHVVNVRPGDGWPGADDPIIEYRHEVMDTHDNTRIYQITTFNYCGNFSTPVVVPVTVVPLTPIEIWKYNPNNQEFDIINEHINDYMVQPFPQYNFIRKVQVESSQFYIKEINAGPNQESWYTVEFSNNPDGGWQFAPVGSSSPLQGEIYLKVTFLLAHPVGRKDAYVLLRSSQGAEKMLMINHILGEVDY